MLAEKLKGKTQVDVLRFYNLWKFTSHYRTWRFYRRLLKKGDLRLWH